MFTAIGFIYQSWNHFVKQTSVQNIWNGTLLKKYINEVDELKNMIDELNTKFELKIDLNELATVEDIASEQNEEDIDPIVNFSDFLLKERNENAEIFKNESEDNDSEN